MTKLIIFIAQFILLILGIALIYFAVRDTDYTLAFASILAFGAVKLVELLTPDLIGIEETEK